jgi:hypothetical protein
MGSKKKTTPTASSLPAIRIGSRVRCTDDGVEGRISWANAVSVKIQWDDGECVTWKRAELGSKPVEFLDAEPAEQHAAQAEPAADQPPEQPTAADESTTEPVAPAAPVAEEPTAPEAPVTELLGVPTVAEPAESQLATDGAPAPGEPLNTELPGGFAIPKRQRKAKAPAEPKVKRLSALDAAAKILAETGTPMTCKELIGTMAAKGYWTSPGGATPHATLNAAILREIAVKGDLSRFVKPAPGRFALRPTV